jgi:molybdopterin/thiamine biosynthesis adenylyltransferase
MVEKPMNLPVSLRIDQAMFERLFDHLFPGDGDEHGAVVAAGIATGSRGTRLLARDLFLARDGVEYVPGTRGYRALTAQFVARVSDYCARERLCYLAIHCHGGEGTVRFSADDLASHERGYPALLDITHGGPIGALVFARNAVAGDLWTPNGRYPLDRLTIVGPHIRTLCPSPRPRPPYADPIYDRSVRLFGDLGQSTLGSLKVGIVGLGGGGSLLSQWLAHLGVGHIVAVDFDRIDPANRPRVAGATWMDAMMPLVLSKNRLLQALGRRLARYKVHVAKRTARRANPAVRYERVVGDVLDEPVARRLTDLDFLFLASDSIQSRLVFNALVQQYLIPGVQIGVKVTTARDTGEIADIVAVTRTVLPGPNQGCLECHKLIPPSRLREEALTADERRAQRYIDSPDVPEPSVITLNVLSAAQAANDLMMMFTGLFAPSVSIRHQIHFVAERTVATVEPRADESCPDCGSQTRSRRARGDRARLPCRDRR